VSERHPLRWSSADQILASGGASSAKLWMKSKPGTPLRCGAHHDLDLRHGDGEPAIRLAADLRDNAHARILR
jgi:hypothetical protein